MYRQGVGMGFKLDPPMCIGRGWVYGVQTGPSDVKRQGVGMGSNRTLQCEEAGCGYMGFKPEPPMCRGKGWVYGVQTGPSNVYWQGVGIWGSNRTLQCEEAGCWYMGLETTGGGRGSYMGSKRTLKSPAVSNIRAKFFNILH